MSPIPVRKSTRLKDYDYSLQNMLKIAPKPHKIGHWRRFDKSAQI